MPSRTRTKVKDTRSKVFKSKRFGAIRGLRAHVCRYVVPPRLGVMARWGGHVTWCPTFLLDASRLHYR